MPKIIISGCNGRMGQALTRICSEDEKIQVMAGIDVNTEKRDSYPVYADPFEFGGATDVVIDFSAPDSLENLLKFCAAKTIPVVLCATGYTEEQQIMIRDAAKTIPVFKSANMSIGVNLMTDLAKRAARLLGGSFDIEIVEHHHKMKVDAPSGTAVMLADALADALPFETENVFERQSVRKPRGKNEIGISSVRGGTIVGVHEVIFAGPDEVIEIKHTAASRDVFAHGAVAAAKFLACITEPGLYNMDHVIKYT